MKSSKVKLNIKVIIVLSLLAINAKMVFSQVGINENNSSPDASAMLDVSSNSKGVLIPRMTTTERNNISSPATGLMIYNSTANNFDYYNGTTWVSVGDTLGNHKAAQNIELSSHWLSNDGTDKGLKIDNNGVVTAVSSSARPLLIQHNTSGNAAYLEVNNAAGTRALFGVDGNGFSGGNTSDVVVANWSNGGLNFMTNATHRAGFSKYGLFTINDTLQITDGSQGTGKVLASDANGIATWLHADSISRSLLKDKDSDTKIYVEKTTNDNKIRFDLIGSERLIVQQNSKGNTQLSLPNTNENIFIGRQAGENMNKIDTPTMTRRNIFIGEQAGFTNISGSDNVFIGHQAGYSGQSSLYNTFIGNYAGAANDFTERQTFVGYEAGRNNAYGVGNVFLGYRAGYNNTTGGGNVFLGENAGYNETGNNKLYIENSNASIPLIWGDFFTNQVGINRVATTNTLEVGGTASKASAGSWLANSDERLKKNIQPLSSEKMLDALLSLQGVTYEWNDNQTGNDRPTSIQYGFTAQNIQEVFPTLVEEDALGYLQTAYGTYDAMTVEAIRALNDKIERLEKENEFLKVQVNKVNQLEVIILELQSSLTR